MAEMSETELIPNQFAYQILRKLSAGNLVRVSRGALGGCELTRFPAIENAWQGNPAQSKSKSGIRSGSIVLAIANPTFP